MQKERRAANKITFKQFQKNADMTEFSLLIYGYIGILRSK